MAFKSVSAHMSMSMPPVVQPKCVCVCAFESNGRMNGRVDDTK